VLGGDSLAISYESAKKVTWACYGFQPVVILALVLLRVLSSNGITSLSFAPSSVMLICLLNIVVCSVLYLTQFNRALYKISPDEHEKLFSLNLYIRRTFAEVTATLSRNESDMLKMVVKHFFIYFSLLMFIIVIEFIIAQGFAVYFDMTGR